MVWAPYKDLYELAGDKKPDWFDEAGVPRFKPFAPRDLNNIYANEAALVEIRCQECERTFLVALSWSSMDVMENRVALSHLVQNRQLGYGDPPFHTDPCLAGYCMSADVKRVVEFWNRPAGIWLRVSELEIETPDSE